MAFMLELLFSLICVHNVNSENAASFLGPSQSLDSEWQDFFRQLETWWHENGVSKDLTHLQADLLYIDNG